MSKIISNLKQSKVGNQARRIYIKAISRRHFKSVIKKKEYRKQKRLDLLHMLFLIQHSEQMI